MLADIQSFVHQEETRPFFKTLLTQDARLEEIDGFFRQLSIVADSFQGRSITLVEILLLTENFQQISALLNIQRMLLNDQRARCSDTPQTKEHIQTQVWNPSELPSDKSLRIRIHTPTFVFEAANNGARIFPSSQGVFGNPPAILNPGQMSGTNWVVSQAYQVR